MKLNNKLLWLIICNIVAILLISGSHYKIYRNKIHEEKKLLRTNNEYLSYILKDAINNFRLKFLHTIIDLEENKNTSFKKYINNKIQNIDLSEELSLKHNKLYFHKYVIKDNKTLIIEKKIDLINLLKRLNIHSKFAFIIKFNKMANRKYQTVFYMKNHKVFALNNYKIDTNLVGLHNSIKKMIFATYILPQKNYYFFIKISLIFSSLFYFGLFFISSFLAYKKFISLESIKIFSENLLSKQESKYKIVLDSISDSVIITDNYGKVIYFNKIFYKKFKPCIINLKDKVKNIVDIFPATEKIISRHYSNYKKDKIIFDCEAIINRKKIYYESIINLIKDPVTQENLGFVWVIHDLTKRKKYEEYIYNLAHFDNLTSLPNKFKMANDLDVIDKKIQQFIIAININKLEKITYFYGFDLSDQILINLAKRMTNKANKFLRKFKIYHWENDTLIMHYVNKNLFSSYSANLFDNDVFTNKFNFIYTDDNGINEIIMQKKLISDIIHNIFLLLKKPFYFANKKIFLKYNIGVSIYPKHGTNIKELVKNAKISAYKASNDGINKYAIYHESMNEQYAINVNIENQLHLAIKNNEFFIKYQPQILCNSGKIWGVEALIRWNKDNKEVHPKQFIPILENSGLIYRVGNWIIDTVLSDTKKWLDKGINFGHISINISAKQFYEKKFLVQLLNKIKKYKIPNNKIILEITESTLIHDIDFMQKVLQKLKKNNINIAIDDFGSGYSSFSYLVDFNINILKIDKSFINSLNNSNIEYSNKALKLIKAIISISNELNLITIAEGIENEFQAKNLKQQNCAILQGKYFSDAIIASKLESLITKNNFFEI